VRNPIKKPGPGAGFFIDHLLALYRLSVRGFVDANIPSTF
jgi:hypothetical protein